MTEEVVECELTKCQMWETHDELLGRRFKFLVSAEFPFELLKAETIHTDRGFEQSIELSDHDFSDPSFVHKQIQAPSLEDVRFQTL